MKNCILPIASIVGSMWLLATATPAQSAVKIACVGDSITASSTRYPTWLANELGTSYEVKNFGVSGTTMFKNPGASYWKTTNFTASGAYLPNIVIIMLGTNDSKISNWNKRPIDGAKEK